MPFNLRIEEGDITRFHADVVLLKYATRYFGADLKVAGLLGRAGISREEMTPGEEGFKLVSARNALECNRVLFVSVPPPGEFDLDSLRRFMLQGLHLLASAGEPAVHVVTTLHGPGFGLDERNAFKAQVDGILSAAAAGHLPAGMERFSIVEANPARVQSMGETLAERMARFDGATLINDGFRITV